MSFDELNINENVLRGVYSHGFEKPSSIQTQAIPMIIKGKDIIAQAQSGTGKTGSFSIGTLCRIDESKKTIQSMIIVPTRELAEQVYKVISDISTFTKITMMKVIGGTNVSMCCEHLRNNPNIIIGTPGRILDMIERRSLPTLNIHTLILQILYASLHLWISTHSRT